MKNVTAAILINDGKILIAKRGPRDKLANKWEFPGGKVEEGETPEECLKREMQEEFQIEVEVRKFLGESIYHYNHGSIKLLAYRTFWHSGNISPEAHEEYNWVSVEQLQDYDFSLADIPFVEMLRRGEIEL
jgi:8-oxo-dGTP diphosphatase